MAEILNVQEAINLTQQAQKILIEQLAKDAATAIVECNRQIRRAANLGNREVFFVPKLAREGWLKIVSTLTENGFEALVCDRALCRLFGDTVNQAFPPTEGIHITW